MSNDLAIATVTATLKRFIGNALTSIAGVSITVGQPDQGDAAAGDQGRVNIFLYQVTQNSGWRNADLPTRRSDGSLAQRPQLALDLYYLLSFYGSKSNLLSERLMGIVMKTLHVQPFLTRQIIRETIRNGEYSFLGKSNLADQPELIKFSPVPLSLEELSKIWSIFFQTQYVLSIAYQGTVVLIEPDDEPAINLPVSDRRLEVAAASPPVSVSPSVITQIRTQAGAEELITAGSTLLIQGRGFMQGELDFIQLEDQQLTPESIRDTEMILPLPASVSAGVRTLQLVYKSSDRSNLAKFILRPQIVAVTLQSEQVQVRLDLSIDKGQKVAVRLDQKTSGHNNLSQNLTGSKQVSNSIAAGDIIEIPAQEPIEPGTYTVWVQVDRAESSPVEASLEVTAA